MEKNKKRKIRYFYVKVENNLHLHKVLHVNRSSDLVTAWDYVDAKRKQYGWSDVRRTMQHAFSISDTADILGLHRMTVDGYIREGKVPKPQRVYDIGTRKPGKYLLSADDVLEMHTAMSEIHQGRPRKDGMVTNNTLPPRAVIRTLVQQGEVLYTKDEEGQFVPIWKEQMW